MQDIQVNEYVRTKNGRIGKIISKKPVYENDKLDYYLYLTSLNEFFYTEKQIKECGWRIEKNLIDIIEVGDYVNEHKIESILDTLSYFDIGFNCFVGINELYIETIVTHEQFKSMEYKVGGDNE